MCPCLFDQMLESIGSLFVALNALIVGGARKTKGLTRLDSIAASLFVLNWLS